MKFFKRKEPSSQDERKMSPWKKWVARIGVVAMAIAATLIPTTQSVFAEQITKKYVYYYANVPDSGISGKFEEPMFFWNGKPTYCIQVAQHMPGPTGSGTGGSVTTGDVFSKTSIDAYSGMSSADKKAINAISYYGYGYTGRDSYDYYFAAQSLIWERLGSASSWYDHEAGVNAAKAAIMADVNNYMNYTSELPNFRVTDKFGNVLSEGSSVNFDKAVVGATYTITETKGILNKFTLSGNDFGNRASVKGNKITVTMDESDYLVNRTIGFKKSVRADIDRGESCIIYSSSYQSQFVVGNLNGAGMYNSVTLKGFGVPVEFTKKNEAGQALANAVMSLYKINSDNSRSLVETYTTTASSKHFDLAPGKYEMIENTPPKGYYKSKPVTFTVEKKPYETQSFEMVDEPLKLKIAKVGANTGNTVKGAHLRLVDQITGKDLATWVTDGRDYIVDPSLLDADSKYFIYEDAVSDGYFLLEDRVTIQIPEYKPADSELVEDYKIYKIEDEEIDYRVTKVDAETGKMISGAKMEVRDTNNNLIDSWTTDGTIHTIPKDNLAAGRTYVIHEVEPPKGYYAIPSDVTFTVDPKFKGTYTARIEDYSIKSSILKVGESGAPVAGATLSIKDSTGTEVDRFTSELAPHSLEGLVNGAEYTAEEIEAPAGYYRTSTPMKFTVKATNVTDQSTPSYVTFENIPIEYYVQKVDQKKKTLLAGAKLQIIDDETGNQVGEDIVSKSDGAVAIPNTWLKAGKSYTVHEKEAVDGYYYAAEDKHFTVPATLEEAKRIDKTEFTITVEDPKIELNIAKVDKETGAYVGGAHLALYENLDDVDNNIDPVARWTSSAEEPYKVSDDVLLKSGHTYYIREEGDVDGYFLNESAVPIEIPSNYNNGKALTVTFENTPIKWHIKKVDTERNLLTTSKDGTFFTLEVYDTQETVDDASDDGTPIATLLTNDATYAANGYFDMEEYIKKGLVRGGHHYRIHETSAGNGYRLAPDQIVQISTTGETETLVSVVEDERIQVGIQKVDDKNNLLSTYTLLGGKKVGFELTIYDEETGDVIATVNTSSEEYQQNGFIDVSEYLSASKTYVVKETAQPRGFYKAKDFTFTVDSLEYKEVDVNGEKKKIGMISMIDPQMHVQFRKENKVGDVIYGVDGQGFIFQIIDTNTDEVVGTIDTLNDPHNEAGYIEIGQYLQEGTTYRIHENQAPQGYKCSEKDAFVTTPGYYVESEGHVQNVVIQFD